MSTSEIKNSIQQMLAKTNDAAVLARVEEYLQALTTGVPLSHQKEVLSRQAAIENGEMPSHSWDDIKKELFN